VGLDVVIVGGSVAGATSAIELGRRGFRVALLERSRFPRWKPCGEGLLPHGVRALADLGLAVPGTPIRGLRFIVPSGASVECDFPWGHGRVVRRDRFDDFLFRIAAETPNVQAHPGVAYDPDRWRARWVIGADGVKSLFHRRPEFVPLRPRSLRIGISTHVRGLHVDPERVEVAIFDGGELYLAPGDGETLVAGLLWKEGVPSGSSNEARMRRLLELRVPERIDRLEFTSPCLACAPLGLAVRAVAAGNVLLVGDAAGAPDPVTGEGMSLAILSARAAADSVGEGSYARRRAELAAGSAWLSSWLLRAMRRPSLAESVVRFLKDRPDIFRRLLEIATGSPVRTGELLRLAI